MLPANHFNGAIRAPRMTKRDLDGFRLDPLVVCDADGRHFTLRDSLGRPYRGTLQSDRHVCIIAGGKRTVSDLQAFDIDGAILLAVRMLGEPASPPPNPDAMREELDETKRRLREIRQRVMEAAGRGEPASIALILGPRPDFEKAGR